MSSYAINDGVRLAYEERGDGEPFLFIQGLGYDRRGFGPLPRLLSEDFRVILFDNRGVGDSDAPAGPYTVELLCSDAVAVLDAAGVESAHVFGVSLGGFIAQELALTHPDRVRKLVLASAAAGSVPPSHPMPTRGQEAFMRFQSMEREEGLRLIVANSLGDHGVEKRPELFEEIYAYRLERAPSIEAWQAQAYAGATFDAYERIPQIAAPTLVLQGGADTVIDPRNADILVERIPGARLELVPDRGHLMMWEEGELLAPIIREFLES